MRFYQWEPGNSRYLEMVSQVMLLATANWRELAVVQAASFKSVTQLESYSLSANRRRCSGLSVC
jgi:hydrogenase maturation factor